MSGLFERLAERAADCPAVAQARAASHASEMDAEVLGVGATVLVVPAAERWTEPREAGMRVSVGGRIGFSCVVALTYPSGFAEWETVRDQLRAVFLGWTLDHPEVVGPAYAAGARLLAYSADHGGRWVHSFDFFLPAQATYEHQS